MSPDKFGWSEFFARQLNPYELKHRLFGRVSKVHRTEVSLLTAQGEVSAARHPDQHPVVGDWVRWTQVDGMCRIAGGLSRRTKLSRTASGGTPTEQIVAANVDVVFVVMGLDENFNLRRLERMLVMAWESGARPVVILTKADLSRHAEDQRESVASVAHAVNIHLCSNISGMGLGEIIGELEQGVTAALVGSSGVGKSTLLNSLYGDVVMATGAVRDVDSKGRHTTTHRELFVLPGTGVIIDNPGIREIQPWDSARGIDGTFSDIVELGERCRFRDCGHTEEPGCAVHGAVKSGQLSSQRLASYIQMRSEAYSLAVRRNEVERRAQDRRTGKLYKTIQANNKRGRNADTGKSSK